EPQRVGHRLSTGPFHVDGEVDLRHVRLCERGSHRQFATLGIRRGSHRSAYCRATDVTSWSRRSPSKIGSGIHFSSVSLQAGSSFSSASARGLSRYAMSPPVSVAIRAARSLTRYDSLIWFTIRTRSPAMGGCARANAMHRTVSSMQINARV